MTKNKLIRLNYDGVIRDVHGDTVTVAYETEDDIVEHVYDRKQFLVPVEEGMRIHIEIVMSERILPKDDDSDDEIDLRVFRKNAIKGSDTF